MPSGHGDHNDAAGLHSDVADSALSFNTQIRDNLLLLAVARDTGTGKFQALAAAYLLDLSGDNLTGVGRTASPNAWAAKQVVNGSSTGRITLPFGTDKYDLASHTDHTDGAHGDTGSKTPGSIWVEGTTLRWVDQSGVEWSHAGVSVGASVGAVGSVWVENVEVHYVTESNTERYVPGQTLHNDAAAVAGSLWMEDQLRWVRQAGAVEYDATHADSHNDTAHGDTGHTDTHTDNAHTDSHSDVAHTDTHNDVAGSNTHTDFAHQDHFDSTIHIDVAHGDTHSDVAHTDTHSDVAGSSSHTDVSHGDTHGDSHTDNAHQDDHFDIAPSNIGAWP